MVPEAQHPTTLTFLHSLTELEYKLFNMEETRKRALVVSFVLLFVGFGLLGSTYGFGLFVYEVHTAIWLMVFAFFLLEPYLKRSVRLVRLHGIVLTVHSLNLMLRCESLPL